MTSAKDAATKYFASADAGTVVGKNAETVIRQSGTAVNLALGILGGVAPIVPVDPLFGLQIVNSNTDSPGLDIYTLSGPAGTRITWQTTFPVSFTGTVTNGRLVVFNTFNNYGGGVFNGEKSGLTDFAAVLCRASVFLPSSDIPIHLTFDGEEQVEIADGGYAVSDVIAETLSHGGYPNLLLTRLEFVSTIENQRMPLGYGYDPTPGGGTVLDDDIVFAGPRTITDAAVKGRVNSPWFILGAPDPLPNTIYQSHACVMFGDSIAGYFTAGIQSAGVAYWLFGSAGHSMYDYTSRTDYASARRPFMFKPWPCFVMQRGVNDWRNGQTLAQMQASFSAIAEEFADAGGQCLIAPTLTPLTTSTDGWVTEVNQTVEHADWAEYNDWICSRDSSNTFGLTVIVIDAAAIVCGTDPEKWEAGFTDDGIHPNSAGNAALASLNAEITFAIQNFAPMP